MRPDRRRVLLGGAALLAGAASPAGSAIAATPPHLRILCFGDSILAGTGLAPRDRLPAQLAAWLNRAGAPALRMRVAAISGDTSYGGRARIGLALFPGADAAIVAIGANDMLLGWPAARAEANLDAILARARRGGRPVLLCGVGAVGRDSWFRDDWNAIWPRLAARHGCLLVADLYAPIRAAGARARRHLLQADGLHPGAEGVAAMVAMIGPKALALTRAARSPGPD